MKDTFLYTVALMGVSDYIYHSKKEKWVYSWMNDKEKKAYNLGWKFARENIA
jgi:hypothetical protein